MNNLYKERDQLTTQMNLDQVEQLLQAARAGATVSINEMAMAYTAEIVTAYVSNHTVAIGEVAALIRAVATAMTAAPESSDPSPKSDPLRPGQTPSGTRVANLLTNDAIQCAECGFRGVMLRRHLRVEHGLTPEAYRLRYNLPADYPMTAPAYAEVRSRLAKENGLGLSH